MPTASIPVPTGGWNARDPLSLMPDTDAIRLRNFFPDTTSVLLRRGFAQHSTGLGTGAVRTLAEFRGKDGTRKLIAAANGNIYDASTSTASSLGSGFGNNEWQTLMFANLLVLANGADAVRTYDGSTLSTPSITGPTSASVIQVGAFKRTFYLIENNSQSIWYNQTINAVAGTYSEFDLSGQLQKGGKIQYAGSWTHDTGTGLEDIFVIVTDSGEVITYVGTDPSDWSLAGRYFLPVLISRRAVFEFGSDLGIVTENGVYVMSQVLRGLQASTGEESYTSKINEEFNLASRLYSGNFGWDGQVYPRGRYMLINIPVVENSISYQYVVNLQTGSWCEFRGMNAASWSLFQEKLYFGGMDGKVYLADTGKDDNGASIVGNVKWAFNYFGDRELSKRFQMARPQIASNIAAVLSFGIDVDYEDNAPNATITVNGSSGTPWGSPWGSPWGAGKKRSDNWVSIAGYGKAGALTLKADFTNTELEITAVDVRYESGDWR